MLGIDPGSEEASGGCRPGRRGGRGRPGAALGVFLFYKPCGGCEWVLVALRFVQALLYRLSSFVLSFVFFYLFFPSFLAGRLTGEEEKGVPRFDSQ